MLLNWWTSNKKSYEIRDLLGEMCSVSWGNVVKEPINSENEPGLQGVLAVRGVWEAQRDVLFNIRVVDTNASSYVSQSVSTDLKNAEEKKKRLDSSSKRHEK